MLLALVFFSIIGMQAFANVRYGTVYGENANFRSFGSASLLLLRCLGKDDWSTIMHDLAVSPPLCTPEPRTLAGYWLESDCGSPVLATLFFGVFYIVVGLVVMSLFVAVILDNFTFVDSVEASSINQDTLDDFKRKWFAMTNKDRDLVSVGGMWMKPHMLPDLMQALGPPLGMDREGWTISANRRLKLITEEVRRNCKTHDKADETTDIEMDDALEAAFFGGDTSFAAPPEKKKKKRKLDAAEVPCSFEAIGKSPPTPPVDMDPRCPPPP